MYEKVNIKFFIGTESMENEFYVYNEKTPIFGRDILRRLPFFLDLDSGNLIPKNKTMDAHAGDNDYVKVVLCT